MYGRALCPGVHGAKASRRRVVKGTSPQISGGTSLPRVASQRPLEHIGARPPQCETDWSSGRSRGMPPLHRAEAPEGSAAAPRCCDSGEA
mmetsp:Transcript_6537/g.18698  ORF Transcript_6537/g.18698 Transcript_6537/m.18698 type:complete len:90 (+) Transcript_6537:802-1071(+)